MFCKIILEIQSDDWVKLWISLWDFLASTTLLYYDSSAVAVQVWSTTFKHTDTHRVLAALCMAELARWLLDLLWESSDFTLINQTQIAPHVRRRLLVPSVCSLTSPPRGRARPEHARAHSPTGWWMGSWQRLISWEWMELNYNSVGSAIALLLWQRSVSGCWDAGKSNQWSQSVSVSVYFSENEPSLSDSFFFCFSVFSHFPIHSFIHSPASLRPPPLSDSCELVALDHFF